MFNVLMVACVILLFCYGASTRLGGISIIALLGIFVFLQCESLLLVVVLIFGAMLLIKS